ncbi:MAG: type II toxin-antitoxin system VapC family toxin [Actinomycetes bacterium]
MIVVDASLVVAALLDGGPVGVWAAEVLGSGDLAAPHLLPVEVASILRRAAIAGDVSDDVAALAHGDLLDLRVALWPYEPLAARCWELRSIVTPYDATYVALAELLDAPLATLDLRLARAPGPRCSFEVPPDG